MQTFRSYGINKATEELSDIDRTIEELEIYGISVIPSLLNEKTCAELISETDRVYAKQEKEF